MKLARTLLTALLAVAVAPATARADRLAELEALVPAAAQAVFIVPDPQGTASRVRNLAAAFSAQAPAAVPPDAGPGLLLGALGLGNVTDGIDPAGPAALAVPAFPNPVVIVPVADYDRFLAALAARGGGAGSLTRGEGGTDIVRSGSRQVAVRRAGGFALLAAQPFLLGQFGAGPSLGDDLAAEERALLAGADFLVRLRGRTLADLGEPLLRARLAAPRSRGRRRSPSGGDASGEGAPADALSAGARRLLEAEVDLLFRGLRQAELIDLGLRLDGERGAFSMLALPVAESGFASIVSSLRPGRHDLLRLAPSDAMMAGSSAIELGPMLGMAETILEVLSGAVETPAAREAVAGLSALMRSWAEVAGPRSIWYAVAAPDAAPFLMYSVNEVSDAEAARAFARRSFELVAALLAGLLEGDPAPGIAIEPGDHRGVPVDHVVMRLPLPPAGPAGARQPPVPFQDGTVHLWLAYPPGMLVGCYYTADPAPVRGFLDRILEGRAGGLLEDPAFRLASRFAPEGSQHVGYFSISRLFEGFSRMALRGGTGVELPPEAGKAVVGVAAYRTGAALRSDITVPFEGIAEFSKAVRALRPPRQRRGPPHVDGPGGPPAPRTGE